MTAATVRRSTTGRAAGTITMHIVSSIITTTTAAPPTTVTPPPATDITPVAIITVATHEPDASRQRGQHHNGQPDLNPASQTLRKIQHRTSFDFHI
jgi:hypothetical protein